MVVGAGGLGCPALQYLGAAGIGTHTTLWKRDVESNSLSGRIGIIDHDRVELSNLQRQILHTTELVGTYKAESAAQALKRCEFLLPAENERTNLILLIERNKATTRTLTLMS